MVFVCRRSHVSGFNVSSLIIIRMRKIVEGAVVLTAALAFMSSYAGNPPELVQDIYSSSGASWSGDGMLVDATAGGMLSLPESEDGDDLLFQGLMGVIESENAGSGVKVVYDAADSCRLVWDARSLTLVAETSSEGGMTVYVADAAGRLVGNVRAADGMRVATMELGDIPAGIYVAGVVIENRLVKTLRFKTK